MLKLKNFMILLLIFILLISACNSNEDSINKDIENPEQVAQALGVLLTKKDYASVYDLFIPGLKEKRTKEDFIKFIEAKGSDAELTLIYDKVVKQNKDLYYGYYTSSGVIERKISPITIEKTNEGWKINGFASYFDDDCAEACIANRINGVDFKGTIFGKCKEAICNSKTSFKCEYNNIEICNCTSGYDYSFDKETCPKDKPLCKNNICVKEECKYSFDCNEVLFKDKCGKLGQDYKFRDVSCIDYKCIVGCDNIKTKTGKLYPEL